MKKRHIIATLLWACCIITTGCTHNDNEKETQVVLETTAGQIRLKLYNDTPIHRDNFINNIKNGIYTGVTFHRVIRNFMIQTGDPATRPQSYNPPTDQNGDTIPERIPAEFNNPTHYNRRGALAAARDPDDENPQRSSDKYQFYIVTGQTYNEEQLRNFETARQQRDANTLYQQKQQQHKTQIEQLRAARDRDQLSDLLEKLQDQAQEETAQNPPITYTKQQQRTYKTQGGAPWLDAEYTVFGEVVEGMKTVETIQKTKTNHDDKPLTPIRIIKAYIVE